MLSMVAGSGGGDDGTQLREACCAERESANDPLGLEGGAERVAHDRVRPQWRASSEQAGELADGR
eukprot:938587-Prymnesium_polylepis.1